MPIPASQCAHTHTHIPVAKLLGCGPVVLVRREAGKPELSNDKGQVRTHETLGKYQLPEDVLVH